MTLSILLILFDLSPEEVLSPLNQFQRAIYNKEEIRKVMEIINNRLNGNALREKQLDEIFEV
jgi:hypothetical protein